MMKSFQIAIILAFMVTMVGCGKKAEPMPAPKKPALNFESVKSIEMEYARKQDPAGFLRFLNALADSLPGNDTLLFLRAYAILQCEPPLIVDYYKGYTPIERIIQIFDSSRALGRGLESSGIRSKYPGGVVVAVNPPIDSLTAWSRRDSVRLSQLLSIRSRWDRYPDPQSEFRMEMLKVWRQRLEFVVKLQSDEVAGLEARQSLSR